MCTSSADNLITDYESGETRDCIDISTKSKESLKGLLQQPLLL